MTEEFGPFAVDPAQVAGLGGALFQELVNRLLDLEVAGAGLAATDLRTSHRENVGDRGVDAALYSAEQTEWLAAGDSAWQFKAGDLGPEGCASEFEGATRAREIVGGGGAYRIVLGKSLEDYLVADREAKLREKARDLGFEVSGDNFKVLDGNQLARWVERHPQLAVSTILGGVGNVAIAFDRWQLRDRHQSAWVPSADRDDLRQAVEQFLDDAAMSELRLEGASGLGKTRGILEALRGTKYEQLVLYVGDAAELTYPLIDHLTGQKRAAVVVIDECTRQRHNVFAEQLQTGAKIKLITIGERDARIPQTLPIGLSPLPEDVIDEVLSLNRAALWPEARRVVVANCAGNVRWALLVAEAVVRDPNVSVGSLIDEGTIQTLVGDLLSGDGNFLALSALALFSRYGIEREMRTELEQIASGLGIPVEDLSEANSKLERLDLVTKHGRYRSVTPQPLAVYLAAHAWEQLGDRILVDLLPSLDESLSERLFLRASDLGTSGPASVALSRILGPKGPFRSLASIAEGVTSGLLIQLAIISPADVTEHLVGLLDAVKDADLQSMKSVRRDLVRTLEKLVWHSGTFERAADMLLRLAECENESWANNATGTWIGLFGSMLPATAATPDARMSYLERVAGSASPSIRKLVAVASDHALDVRGMVMVSGELQGGVIVEPRGTPETDALLWDYVRRAIQLLRQIATEDPDAEVRATAEKSLIGAIHPLLENEAVRDVLFDALSVLPSEALIRVRTEVEHLYALFERVESLDLVAATNSGPDVAVRRAGLDVLRQRLPEADPADDLASLAYAKRWEWEDGELEKKIKDVATALPQQAARGSLLALLGSQQIPEASFELGAAVHAIASGEESVKALAQLADRGNIAGLVGYLHASIAAGDTDAFDRFLDGPHGLELDPATRLAITVRGPRSDLGWSRLIELMKVLPVRLGAPGIFGWHVDVDEKYLIALLDEWIPKIDSQLDYNQAVDVLGMMVWRRPDLNAQIESRIVDLTEQRVKYPDVGQEGWDWVQLARRRLPHDADNLVLNLLQQVDAGSLHIFGETEERGLLRDALTVAGPGRMDEVLSLIQTGSWRVQMDLRGWLADVYPSEAVMAWVGDDVERAGLVAGLTSVGGGAPSGLVRALLDRFGSDDGVAGALYVDFVTGSWVGSESSRLTSQIDQLSAWTDPAEPEGVRRWARRVIDGLKERRSQALELEAERGW